MYKKDKVLDKDAQEILDAKYKKLLDYLKQLGSVAVAFSGGVDSTFLLYAAKEALGDKAIAVTVSANFVPERELTESNEFCGEHGIKQFVARVNESEIEGFAQNPPNRCYICKHAIFSKILGIAGENGINEVVEGSNVDDEGDYRPGMQALKELEIKSPLREAGLTKADIRALSKTKGLPTWDKPSFACLASRFPYGEIINEMKLSMVDKAEQYLMELGFQQFRVRIHGNIARIEVLPEDIHRIMEDETRLKIHEKFKKYGFDYVTLDLQGYRTGSMNEVLNLDK